MAALGDVAAVSPLYETEPVGGPDQGAYLNAVALVDTGLPPRALLDACLRLERERGRQRRERWGPRTLDVDVLIYDGLVVDEPGLRVPHPRMTGRRFVLAPLLDVWPEATLPDGTRLADALPAVADQQITRLDAGEWWAQDPSSGPGSPSSSSSR